MPSKCIYGYRVRISVVSNIYDPGEGPGVGVDPRGDGSSMDVFISSCPVSVYMVIGWGSWSFSCPGGGGGPRGDEICMYTSLPAEQV